MNHLIRLTTKAVVPMVVLLPAFLHAASAPATPSSPALGTGVGLVAAPTPAPSDAVGSATTGVDSVSAASMGWNTENQYWQNQYQTRPYYDRSIGYSAYAPAYRYGVTLYNQSGGKPYHQLDANRLRDDWVRNRNASTLSWDQANPATRDAYERMYNSRVAPAAKGAR